MICCHGGKYYIVDTKSTNINVTINDGDIISIIGPSGTGKSTLLRCLNLLQKPTKGNVYFDGVKQDIIDTFSVTNSVAFKKLAIIPAGANIANY